MDCLESELNQSEYLLELSRCFESPFRLWQERVCGIVIGPFFSVAHHCEHEWNRRITGEINRAWGFVRRVDGKAWVYYIRGKGMLSPLWFLILTLVMSLLLSGNDLAAPMLWLVSAVCSLVICGITALTDSLTDAGVMGAEEIEKILCDPKHYSG